MIIATIFAFCTLFFLYAAIQLYRVEKEVAWDYIAGTVSSAIAVLVFSGAF